MPSLSNIVALHCPSNTETRVMIDARFLVRRRN